MKTDETEYNENGIQGLEIVDENWQEDIKTVFEQIEFYPYPDTDRGILYYDLEQVS